MSLPNTKYNAFEKFLSLAQIEKLFTFVFCPYSKITDESFCPYSKIERQNFSNPKKCTSPTPVTTRVHRSSQGGRTPPPASLQSVNFALLLIILAKIGRFNSVYFQKRFKMILNCIETLKCTL